MGTYDIFNLVGGFQNHAAIPSANGKFGGIEYLLSLRIGCYGEVQLYSLNRTVRFGHLVRRFVLG